MNASRRTLLGATALAIPAALLAGCAAGGSAPALTPQQVIDDANNTIQALGAAVTNLAVAQPNLIPAAVVTQIKSYTADAASALSALSSSVAATTGAAVLQQVVADIQAVLNALAAIPGLPPQIGTVAGAAGVVLPMIVAFIQTYFPQFALPVKAQIGASMTPAQARAVLSAAH